MFWKRKKKTTSAEPSFKERVDEFWDWWATNSGRFLETIEDAKCGDLQPEISAAVDKLGQRFAWVFGPPEEGESGHSFTLSGEGDLNYQFLTAYWLKRAPILENWIFYSSRQPGIIHPAAAIETAGERFEFGGLWITPTIDEERECVDVTAWHPAFDRVERKTRDLILYVMLDEVL